MKRLHLFLFSASAGLVAASVAMTGYFYAVLPDKIPTHFGFTGTPDAWAAKDFFIVFLIPLLNILLLGLFVIIYRHPQYTSWPTTLILMAVEEKKREKIFEILRTMNVGVIFWITLLFAYLQFSILATGNERIPGISDYIMIGFLSVIFLIIVLVNTRMFFTVRKLIKK